jgi:hypothetical protein
MAPVMALQYWSLEISYHSLMVVFLIGFHTFRSAYILENAHHRRDISYELPFHMLSISTIGLIELPWDKLVVGWEGYPLDSWIDNVQLTGMLIFLFILEFGFLFALSGPIFHLAR